MVVLVRCSCRFCGVEVCWIFSWVICRVVLICMCVMVSCWSWSLVLVVCWVCLVLCNCRGV